MPGLILVQGTTRIPGGEIEVDESLVLARLPGGGRGFLGAASGGGDAVIAAHGPTHHADGSDPIDLDSIAGTLTPSKLASLDFSGGGELIVDSATVAGTLAADGNVIAGGYVSPGTSGVNFNSLLDGQPPLFNIPATATICTNLIADQLDGQHGPYYLDLANATGTLGTARGGTGADGSALAASLVLASPVAGGAAIFRALDAADIPALDTAKVTTGQFGLARMPRAAAGKVLRAAGAGVDPAYTTLTIPDTVADQDLLIATALNTVGVVAKPASTSVLTHTGAAYAWAAALQKAQQHAQTAYLDVSNVFSLNQTFSGAIICATIRRATADGSDTSLVEISGGGDTNTNRGALLQLAGNEQASIPGRATLLAGATGYVNIGPVVVVGTATTPNAAALMQFESTTKGVLLPRLTTTQRDAIASPPAGLLIYNTTTGKLNIRAAAAWEAVTSA
jgi:hypothetical protein